MSNSGVSDAVVIIGAASVLAVGVGIMLFVLLVWSMISMIMLNSRFKHLYEEYQKIKPKIIQITYLGQLNNTKFELTRQVKKHR